MNSGQPSKYKIFKSQGDDFQDGVCEQGSQAVRASSITQRHPPTAKLEAALCPRNGLTKPTQCYQACVPCPPPTHDKYGRTGAMVMVVLGDLMCAHWSCSPLVTITPIATIWTQV
ncbi:hypothetical protein Pcinc_023400 [Petrolisthes cinctipes]|uniref:Uncharacterized protein n=1 Tax=Petrolisthes cinctipes TaxID=88211 RepID=A0AAE1KC98_PETCI|nr:hypothetical protein Pcinc_023400 [Petrolisthes cinctipes]